MNNDNICFGIDFGTTNSCISFWYENNPIIIKDIDDSEIIPTVIEITDNKKIIGQEAYKRKEIFESVFKYLPKFEEQPQKVDLKLPKLKKIQKPKKVELPKLSTLRF